MSSCSGVLRRVLTSATRTRLPSGTRFLRPLMFTFTFTSPANAERYRFIEGSDSRAQVCTPSISFGHPSALYAARSHEALLFTLDPPLATHNVNIHPATRRWSKWQCDLPHCDCA